MNEIYKGALVRLSAIDPEEAGKAFSSWDRDSEFRRLLDSGVAAIHSQKQMEKWVEKDLDEQSSGQYWFAIRRLDDDTLLGDVGLYVINWTVRDAFIGIAIGDRAFWGKGYGTDAMRVIVRYAFNEVNLNRVTLGVFEYNPRAIRAYEKAGFRLEGRERKSLNKEGKRWDMLFMGILKSEWND